ncbi:MAG: Fic family protein [Betaproteobacteria bacterium]|nr:Fic family protein [Betaproteobacteria bacterium]
MADDKKDNSRLGNYVPTVAAGKAAQAFIPPVLPPVPPLQLEPMLGLLEQAQVAIGKLEGLAQLLPDVDRFIYAYLRKEALLSSQIEGTQSSLSDLLLHEIEAAPGVPAEDVEEVSNYVAAIRAGLSRVREGYPVTLNLMRDLHRILLQGQRGRNKDPGELRRSQVWIQDGYGRINFVPPPADQVLPLLGKLEKYINEEKPSLPVLVRAALIHAQFETIHPFHDGNGRLGRLLITLFLCAGGLMREPTLYLSLYFKINRNEYYRALQDIRQKGAWEEWVEFFLRGVAEVANEAATTARELTDLIKTDRDKILARSGRSNAAVYKVYDLMEKQIYATVPNVQKELNVSAPTARSALVELLNLGIVKEVTGQDRNRVYVYTSYLEILQRGAEPIK